MGKLFLFAIGLMGFGIAMSRPLSAPQRLIPVAEQVRVAPEAMPTFAYRPGEPSLTPGAIELQRSWNGHFTSNVSVNGQMVDMVIDTGATSVALTVDDARRLGLMVDPTAFQVGGTGASGPVRGMHATLSDVALGDRHAGPIDAVVIEGLDQSLLGQSYLSRLERVSIEGDTMSLR